MVGTSNPESNRRRWSHGERIVLDLHLSGGILDPGKEMKGWDESLDGRRICERLGISDLTELSRQMRTLQKRGLVSYEFRRVKGIPHKRKLALLTPSGTSEAMRLEHELCASEVFIPAENKTYPVRGLAERWTEGGLKLLWPFMVPSTSKEGASWIINRDRLFSHLAMTKTRHLLRLFGVEAQDPLDRLDMYVRIISRYANLDRSYLALQVLGEFPELRRQFYLQRKMAASVSGQPEDFERLISTVSFERALQEFPPRPSLQIRVDPDIKTLTFRGDETKLVLDHPTLLWECSCRLPEGWRNAGYQCRIHSSPNGGAIASAFGKLNLIEYGKVRVLWRNEDTLWPPAIDSLVFAKTLLNRGYDKRDLRSVADIGCGTGFLGILLAKHNQSVSRTLFSDVYVTPVLCSKVNWDLNALGSRSEARFLVGDGFSGFPKEPLDLLLCNPPYLPLLDHVDMASVNAVAGTKLLQEVIRDGGKYAKELLVGCSSIALSEFNHAVDRSEPRLLSCLRVPFRVQHAFGHPDYLRDLLCLAKGSDMPPSEDESYLVETSDSPFRYWHDVRIYSICF